MIKLESVAKVARCCATCWQLIDGVDTRSLNIQWLRSCVAYSL